jgi:hypothetical protein
MPVCMHMSRSLSCLCGGLYNAFRVATRSPGTNDLRRKLASHSTEHMLTQNPTDVSGSFSLTSLLFQRYGVFMWTPLTLLDGIDYVKINCQSMLERCMISWSSEC